MPNADGKLELGTQADVDAQTRDQVHIIDLMLNNIAIIGNGTALLVNLGADDVALIIHLVARVAGIVLVDATIEARVSAVSLAMPNKNAHVVKVAGSVKRLPVLLLITR